jgi:phosphatidate cytidylyltransferase
MLLSNPLAYPFLPPLGITLVGLFASSLLALLLSVRGQWQLLTASVLFQRWRTWIVIAPLFSLAALSGSLPVAMLAAALGAQGAREYADLHGMPRADRCLLLGAGVAGPLLCSVAPAGLLGLGLLLLPLVASLPALLAQDVETGVRRLGQLGFGLWYLPVTLGLMVLLGRDPRGGPGLLLALGLAVALSDVGAFTVGRLFGRRALAARLSPSKTWAGVLGNLGGAALGLGLLAPLAPQAPRPALVLVVALGAVWGDLLESLLKRAAHAKDSAGWLPGFGGLLDRADSLLVVLPLSYVLVEVITW